MKNNRTGHPTHTIGQYRGVDYMVHRLGDIFPHEFDSDPRMARRFFIFEYDEHAATGNYFLTKAEFELWVDEIDG